MTGNKEVSSEDLIDLHRRHFLRGLAASPFAGAALSAEAGAASNREITVSQGGTEVATVVPYSHGMTVDRFYSYNGKYRGSQNSSANTPSDVDLEQGGVSQLFFHEYTDEQNKEVLSLVMIHDEPGANSGSHRVEFEGVPDSGSWTVKDDPTHAPDEYPADGSFAEWGWGSCCTDGGAYSWSDEGAVEFTVAPAAHSSRANTPFEGIHTWKLRSGDGTSATLDTSRPVTVTVGERVPDDELGALVDEKLALAQRVTNASLSVDDVSIAGDALETLTNNISSGAVSEGTAKEAVRRLKLGENVTETGLVAPNPTDVISPENPRTLVGADRSHSYNLVDKFADLLVNLCAIAAVLAGVIASSAAAVVGGVAVAATNELYAAVKGLLGAISFGANSIAELFDSGTLDAFAEVVKNASNPEKAFASDLLEPAKEEIRTDAQQMMETGYRGSLEPVLERFTDALGGEDADSGDPTPDFEGTTGGATQSAERGVQRIEDLVANEVSDLEQTNLITGIIDVAAGITALGSVFFGVPSIIASILAGVSIIMKTLQTVDTFGTFEDVVTEHDYAVLGVRRGEVISRAQ